MRTNSGTLSSPAVLALAWSMKKEATVYASLVCTGWGHRFTAPRAVRGSHSPTVAVCAPLDDGLPLHDRMLVRIRNCSFISALRQSCITSWGQSSLCVTWLSN